MAVKKPGLNSAAIPHSRGAVEPALALAAPSVLSIHAHVLQGAFRSEGPDAVGEVQHEGAIVSGLPALYSHHC